MDPLLYLVILFASAYGLILYASRRHDSVILVLSVLGLWLTVGASVAVLAAIVAYLLRRG